MKESSQVRKLLITTAVIILSFPVIAGATLSANDAGHAVVRVSYADLDLSRSAGITTLYQRIQSTSDAACGARRSLIRSGSLQGLMKHRHCYNDLVSKLVAQANNAKLSEMHAG